VMLITSTGGAPPHPSWACSVRRCTVNSWRLSIRPWTCPWP